VKEFPATNRCRRALVCFGIRPGRRMLTLAQQPVTSDKRERGLMNIARGIRLSYPSLVAAFCLCLSADVVSQEWFPTRAVRLIVPFPAGGGSDIVARLLGSNLSSNWRQQVVVDNRAGAGGIIGTEIAAKSSPDGYTLLFGNTSTLANNISLYKKLPYHPIEDFAPVSLIASTPNALMVHPGVPARSVNELISLARSRPGSLTYASAGNGTTAHLSMELFKSLASLDIVNVPYKGNAPALIDLLSGQVQLMFPTIVSALPHAKSGKLRALATTGARRSPVLSDVPTMAEAGVSGYESTLWYGVLAPNKTPGHVVKSLNDEILKILKNPQIQDQLVNQGADPIGSTPPEFSIYLKAEIVKWGKVIQRAGIRVD